MIINVCQPHEEVIPDSSRNQTEWLPRTLKRDPKILDKTSKPPTTCQVIRGDEVRVDGESRMR